MSEEGMTGNYTFVDVDAEMLITHGVEPKSKAPSCAECHDSSGKTADGTKMIPFAELGYHTWPAKVRNCTLCHEAENLSWTAMHNKHASGEAAMACTSCHTAEPAGLVKPKSDLCNDCHGMESWQGSASHGEHVQEGIKCVKCHRF